MLVMRKLIWIKLRDVFGFIEEALVEVLSLDEFFDEK